MPGVTTVLLHCIVVPCELSGPGTLPQKMNTHPRFFSPAFALVAFIIGLASASTATAQTFLTIDGIVGESKYEGFEGSMDILAFSWGAWTASASNNTGSGARAGRPELQDLALSKLVDSTSPELFFRTMSGQVIPSAKVQVARSSGDKLSVYFTLELKNVTVATVQHSHSSGDYAMESITLAYTSIKMTHVAADGTVTERSWDLTKAR
jgi:type VI secretion system secreted protein Hcp